MPKPQPPAPRETSPYRLPDGRVVLVYEDVARGAASVTYEMLRTADGARVIVNAVKVTPLSAPAWCQQLAKDIVTTVNEWAADGASEKHLIGCVADLLEQELLDQSIIERLAQVYTVDTDQAALIGLVRDAQQEVGRR